MKEKDLQFIKNFNKVTLRKVCQDLELDYSNLLQGRCSEEKTHEAVIYLKKLIKELEDEEDE